MFYKVLKLNPHIHICQSLLSKETCRISIKLCSSSPCRSPTTCLCSLAYLCLVAIVTPLLFLISSTCSLFSPLFSVSMSGLMHSCGFRVFQSCCVSSFTKYRPSCSWKSHQFINLSILFLLFTISLCGFHSQSFSPPFHSPLHHSHSPYGSFLFYPSNSISPCPFSTKEFSVLLLFLFFALQK